MMLWTLISIAVCAVSAAQGQPTGCSDDSQCTSGYYCLADVHYCRECIQCEELHRQPPRTNTACIRSVAECGPCLKGYVDDRLGMGSGCTEPESEVAATWYLWLLGGLLVAALLLCAAGVVVYALRNTDTFRVLASTRTSVEAPVAKAVAPTAPQPPPYNYSAPYEPVRPASPDSSPSSMPYAEGDYYRPTSNSDPSQPLVKRVPSGGGGGGAGAGEGGARESAGSQAARPFSIPAYVRNVPPPSYESAFSDDSDHETPFVVHDEDTMPSAWTPQNHHDNGNETTAGSVAESAGAIVPAGAGGGGGGGGGAVALLRPARGAHPPPNKMRCVEDTNNNRNRDGGISSSGPPPSPPPGRPAGPPAPPAPAAPAAAPSVVINVLNLNSIHQRNDVTL